MLLEISTAIICPMECSYCPQVLIASRYDGPRLMTVETFAKCLGNSPGNIPLSFAGFAEPYLNRECSAMIAMAAAEGHGIQVYTTGAGMNDSDVELLIRLQPYNVVLHLPDAEGDMKLKITDAYVARMRRLAEGIEAFKAVCFGTIPESLAWAAKWIAGYRLQSRAGNVAVQVRKSGPLRCVPDPQLENNVLIPDGSLVLCCQDYGLTHIIGNLLRETWDSIHSGSAMIEMKRKMAGEDCLCRTCEYAECAS